VVEYARLYTPDLAGWFTKFGQVPAYYDANGHYARVMPVFSPAVDRGGTLEAVAPTERLAGYERGILRHCPGSAVQPVLGAAPLAAPGCDPADTPPGP
jgi:phospholipid/cholesterol/gamma-HCH transport system substrate-binding protein